MKIKFKEYEMVEGEKQTGETWKAYIIHGTKLENGEAFKSVNIFDNKHNQNIINKLRTLETGDKVDVKHVKNGRFWNITDIIPTNGDDPAPPQRTGNKTSTGGGKKRNSSDSMSKEEWAEKNRVDSVRIAKSVALKAAVEAGNTTPAKAIKFAEGVLDWLIEVPEVPSSTNDGTDPLDPPA
jgi:hypothetical protein